MNSEEVSVYLQQHPEFFEEYADMLAKVFVPHPHGGRATPISERQVLTLRKNSRQLEAKLKELIEFGEKNDTIGERLHEMTLAILSAKDSAATIQGIHASLRDGFNIPHVALKLWSSNAELILPEVAGASAEAQVFAESLTTPYCSSRAMMDTQTWFTADQLKSFAYVGLRNDKTFGLLALACEDAHRFYPEMGTLYLKRLGEIASKGLARYL